MGPVNTRLVERARSIFADLGYTVEGSGREFTAEREWKVVHVNAVEDATLDTPPESGDLRCFVAEADAVDALEHRLRRTNPDYEWAIIGVDGDEYEVERAPSGPSATV